MAKTAILSVRIVSNAKDAERGIDRTGRNLRKLGDNSRYTGQQLARMHQSLDRTASVVRKIGAATVAAQSLTVAAAATGKALAPLAGLLAALPGSVGAAGAGFAFLKTVTAGFSDAVVAAGEGTEEFNEAMKDLPPSMRDAVRATVRVGDSFKRVQRDVQSTFWKGLDRDITRLGRVAMPVLDRAMQSVAREARPFASEMLRAASSREAMRAVGASFSLVSEVLRDLTPAVQPFVKGIAQIVAGSAEMMDGFNGAEAAAKRFHAWATRISGDGSLERWFENGKVAAQDLWNVIEGAGRIFDGVMRAASDAAGPGGLEMFGNELNRIADIINRPEVQAELREAFARAKEITAQFYDLLEMILPKLIEYGDELLVMAVAYKAAQIAVAGYRGAVLLATGAQTAFNLALAANPIGLLIAGLVIAAGAAALLYYKVEWVREGVDRLTRGMTEDMIRGWGKISRSASLASTTVRATWALARVNLSGVATLVGYAWRQAWQGVSIAGRIAAFGVRAAFSTVRAWATYGAGAVETVWRIGMARVRAAFGTIGGAARWAFNGVVSAARWAMGQVSYAVSWIRQTAASVSGVWSRLWSSGTMHQRVTVASTLPEPGKPFYLHAAGPVLSPTTWGSPRGGMKPSVVTYNVTVTGAVDPNATARQIKQILREDSRRDGHALAGGGLW